jgi:5-methylcytosine-specific restriction enzyme subunit McrC
MAAALILVAYEHQTLRLGQTLGLREEHLTALLALQERYAARWFTPLRRGLKLSSYVGIIQVTGLTLEILPKLDDPGRVRNAETEAAHWQHILLRLLKVTHNIAVAIPSSAALAQARHSMLDLFVMAFLTQVETLLRQGLKKQYYITEGNRRVLRGRLLFAQQLRHNLVHAEQFYSRAQTYDATHPLNALLRQALQVAAEVSQSAQLAARARSVLGQWPEMPSVPVPVEKPILTHATARYGPALELALLLLWHHSPAPQAGRTAAVALLFDMNRLFEAYVAQQLARAAPRLDCRISAQSSRLLWDDVHVRPDIVVTLPDARIIVLDTKWKHSASHRPTAADLQQLFTYCHLWKATHGLLVYPNPAAELGISTQQPYAPGRLELAVQGHVLFADILLPDGNLNLDFGLRLLEQLLALPR